MAIKLCVLWQVLGLFQYLMLTEPAQLGQKLQSAQFVRSSTLSPSGVEDVEELGSGRSELSPGNISSCRRLRTVFSDISCPVAVCCFGRCVGRRAERAPPGPAASLLALHVGGRPGQHTVAVAA